MPTNGEYLDGDEENSILEAEPGCKSARSARLDPRVNSVANRDSVRLQTVIGTDPIGNAFDKIHPSGPPADRRTCKLVNHEARNVCDEHDLMDSK